MANFHYQLSWWNPNYLVILSHQCSTTVSLETDCLYSLISYSVCLPVYQSKKTGDKLIGWTRTSREKKTFWNFKEGWFDSRTFLSLFLSEMKKKKWSTHYFILGNILSRWNKQFSCLSHENVFVISSTLLCVHRISWFSEYQSFPTKVKLSFRMYLIS